MEKEVKRRLTKGGWVECWTFERARERERERGRERLNRGTRERGGVRRLIFAGDLKQLLLSGWRWVLLVSSSVPPRFLSFLPLCLRGPFAVFRGTEADFLPGERKKNQFTSAIERSYDDCSHTNRGVMSASPPPPPPPPPPPRPVWRP